MVGDPKFIILLLTTAVHIIISFIYFIIVVMFQHGTQVSPIFSEFLYWPWKKIMRLLWQSPN